MTRYFIWIDSAVQNVLLAYQQYFSIVSLVSLEFHSHINLQ